MSSTLSHFFAAAKTKVQRCKGSLYWSLTASELVKPVWTSPQNRRLWAFDLGHFHMVDPHYKEKKMVFFLPQSSGMFYPCLLFSMTLDLQFSEKVGVFLSLPSIWQKLWKSMLQNVLYFKSAWSLTAWRWASGFRLQAQGFFQHLHPLLLGLYQ